MTDKWMQETTEDFETWLREEAKARSSSACHYDYGERELQQAFSAAMRVAYTRALEAADRAAREEERENKNPIQRMDINS